MNACSLLCLQPVIDGALGLLGWCCKSPVHLHCFLTTCTCRVLGQMTCRVRFELVCAHMHAHSCCRLPIPTLPQLYSYQWLRQPCFPRSSRLQPSLPPSSLHSGFYIVLEMQPLVQPQDRALLCTRPRSTISAPKGRRGGSPVGRHQPGASCTPSWTFSLAVSLAFPPMASSTLRPSHLGPLRPEPTSLLSSHGF